MTQQPPPPRPPAGPPDYALGPQASTPAVISLISGIAAIPLSCLCGIGALAGIAAVVTGILGIRDIQRSEGSRYGTWMAVTGLVLGALMALLVIGFMIAAIATGNFHLGVYSRPGSNV